MRPTPARHGILVVHRADGVIEIPLTGDPRSDALLERLARRSGGPVTKQPALDLGDDADGLARAAMREGA